MAAVGAQGPTRKQGGASSRKALMRFAMVSGGNLAVILASIGLASIIIPNAPEAMASRLQVIGITVGVLVIIDMAILTYFVMRQSALMARRPALGVMVRNRSFEGRSALAAGRENILELAVGNGGEASASHIHVALKWSGPSGISVRAPDGTYPDRRYWAEREPNVWYFTGGLEKVALAGRQVPIAELHVSRPNLPLKVMYRVFCEDMDEIQGEVEVALIEQD